MIIQGQDGKVITISTDTSILDKLVLFRENKYQEVNIYEVSRVSDEVHVVGGYPMMHVSVRIVKDELVEEETAKNISTLMTYFEGRYADKESEYQVVFDVDRIPFSVGLAVEMGEFRLEKISKIVGRLKD